MQPDTRKYPQSQNAARGLKECSNRSNAVWQALQTPLSSHSTKRTTPSATSSVQLSRNTTTFCLLPTKSHILYSLVSSSVSRLPSGQIPRMLWLRPARGWLESWPIWGTTWPGSLSWRGWLKTILWGRRLGYGLYCTRLAVLGWRYTPILRCRMGTLWTLLYLAWVSFSFFTWAVWVATSYCDNL